MTEQSQSPRASAGAPDDPLPAWPGEMWQLGDRELFVREMPQGQAPALFVHGLGGSSTNWTDLMHELAGDVTGLAVDLSGFGYSPPPADGDYRPHAQARALADLLRRWDAGPVHVFGNSMGGAIALQLAAKWPEHVRSLTLISPALPQYTAMRSSIHLPVLSVPGVGERILERFRQADPAMRAQTTIDVCYADPSRVHPERMAEAAAEVERRDALDYTSDAFLKSLRGLLATYRDASERRPWKLAERVMSPTLMVYGRQDQLVDSRSAHRASRHFADVRVIMMPDCGHVAMMEHPERVAQQWRDFWSDSVRRAMLVPAD